MSRNGAHPRPPLQPHLPALDGVRGLAILMVICFHVFLSNSMGYGRLSRAVGTALHYGIFGVDLFFALSGFLITGVLVDSLGDRGFFRKFYARRALRIFPLYYGVLLVLFAATPLLGLHWRGMGWLLLGYLQNLRPEEIGTYSPGHSIGLNHFWSLAVEEQFYLVWPALVFWVGNRRRLLALTLWVSAAALVLRLALVWGGVGSQPIHVWTVTRADSLLLGGALALLYRSPAWGQAQRWAPAFCLGSAAVVLGSILLLPQEFVSEPFTRTMRLWVDGPRYTFLALGSCGLIGWALTPGSVFARVFGWGTMRFFGRYSYGIYVLHMVALSPVLERLRPAIAQATHSKMLGVAGAGVLSIGGAVALAYVSFHFFEKPFLRLKHHFDYVPERAAWVETDEVLVGPSTLRLVDSKSYIHEVSLHEQVTGRR